MRPHTSGFLSSPPPSTTHTHIHTGLLTSHAVPHSGILRSDRMAADGRDTDHSCTVIRPPSRNLWPGGEDRKRSPPFRTSVERKLQKAGEMRGRSGGCIRAASGSGCEPRIRPRLLCLPPPHPLTTHPMEVERNDGKEAQIKEPFSR